MKSLVQKKDTKACHTLRAHPTGSAAGSDSLSETVLSLQTVKPLTGVQVPYYTCENQFSVTQWVTTNYAVINSTVLNFQYIGLHPWVFLMCNVC